MTDNLLKVLVISGRGLFRGSALNWGESGSLALLRFAVICAYMSTFRSKAAFAL